MIEQFHILEKYIGKYFIIPHAFSNGADLPVYVATTMILSDGDGIYKAGLCFESISEGYLFIAELSGQGETPEAALNAAVSNVKLVTNRFQDEDPLGPDGKPKP